MARKLHTAVAHNVTVSTTDGRRLLIQDLFLAAERSRKALAGHVSAFLERFPDSTVETFEDGEPRGLFTGQWRADYGWDAAVSRFVGGC